MNPPPSLGIFVQGLGNGMGFEHLCRGRPNSVSRSAQSDVSDSNTIGHTELSLLRMHLNATKGSNLRTWAPVWKDGRVASGRAPDKFDKYATHGSSSPRTQPPP